MIVVDLQLTMEQWTDLACCLYERPFLLMVLGKRRSTNGEVVVLEEEYWDDYRLCKVEGSKDSIHSRKEWVYSDWKLLKLPQQLYYLHLVMTLLNCPYKDPHHLIGKKE